jgi:hypothetical protein
MSVRKNHEDVDVYGTPACAVLDGTGSGFTRVLYGASAREDEKSRRRVLASPESDRLTQLRARLAGDPSFDASQVDVAFEDGALHLSGVMHDEKAWFALVSVAGTFATTVVDEIHVRKDAPR